ncbi:T9SS type A sorting domain-containing protein [Psychroserpens sp. AS72]|uniref:T9SS type A sorting domain-containing protein n=1 Tax=Psychroserpens sp. AS72 TaxID=3135775 RepID=UPI003174A384
MKKKILFLTIVTICFNIHAQIQVSNFTYNNVQNSSPTGLQEFNGKILFSAVNDGYGRELWSSNGTSSNTNIVIDIEPGETDGLYTFYSTILNNEFYFVAKDDFSFSGGEIWKTDGTETGSSLVTNYIGTLYGLTTVGNQIYFTIKTSEYSIQIWKSDGTPSGTVLVKDNIALWNTPSFIGSVNDLFIFTIQVPSTNNSKVWRSDGTNAGTYALTGELDGNGSAAGGTSDLSQYIKFNNKLYFITRYSLYETNGTTSGTNNITSVWNAQNNLVDFGDSIELNGKIYFSFFSKDLKKLSIYKSDGTSSGTSEIYTVTSSQYFYPSYLNTSGDNLIFSSINSNNGTSLFYLNNTTNSVTEIIEIDPTAHEPNYFFEIYSVLSLDNIDGNLFFISSPTEVSQKKGWILDEVSSTLNHVEALDNIVPRIDRKISFNNALYYSKDNQLWKFDTNSLSVNSIKEIEEFQVFPNPTSEFISFNRPDDINQIKIYDLKGRLVFEADIFTYNKINIENINSGTYIIKILGKNGRITNRKLLKK